MHKKIYLTGLEKTSGKSFVSLAVAAAIKKTHKAMQAFKLFSETDDAQSILLSKITDQSIHSIMPIDIAINLMREQPDELISQVLSTLTKKTIDYFEGSDFESDNNLFEFEFNLRLAAQIGCDVMIVVSAENRSPKQLLSIVINAGELAKKNHANMVSVIINRVPIHQELETQQLLNKELKAIHVIVIPEFDILSNPTVGDIARKLRAEIIVGESEVTRPVKQITIAAKTIGNFLESRLDRQGMLIITPGDRTDILLGTLLADQSANYPKIAGIVLTGGDRPSARILDIISGLENPYPILLTEIATYETATQLFSAKYRIEADNIAKANLVIEKFSPYVYQSINQLLKRQESLIHTSPALFLHELVLKVRKIKRHIVLPEGEDPRILMAADYLLKRNIVHITLLGNKDKINLQSKRLQLELPGVSIIEIEKSEKKLNYVDTYLELRKHKNINLPIALERLSDANYFAVMMVYAGDADGMVSGADHTTADTVRPALEIIKTKANSTKVSSVFIMCMPTRILIYGDCAINPEPDSELLAEITYQAADIAQKLGVPPRIALLSYSSGSSGKGESVEKVVNAVLILKSKHPELLVEGPIQYDAAVDVSVAAKKMPQSKLAGNANILIFPDLNTGNNTYKAVQRETGALAIGPILLGLNKPVNDLSRGCTYQDIINTILVTALQAGETDVNFGY